MWGVIFWACQGPFCLLIGRSVVVVFYLSNLLSLCIVNLKNYFSKILFSMNEKLKIFSALVPNYIRPRPAREPGGLVLF